MAHLLSTGQLQERWDMPVKQVRKLVDEHELGFRLPGDGGRPGDRRVPLAKAERFEKDVLGFKDPEPPGLPNALPAALRKAKEICAKMGHSIPGTRELGPDGFSPEERHHFFLFVIYKYMGGEAIRARMMQPATGGHTRPDGTETLGERLGRCLPTDADLPWSQRAFIRTSVWLPAVNADAVARDLLTLEMPPHAKGRNVEDVEGGPARLKSIKRAQAEEREAVQRREGQRLEAARATVARCREALASTEYADPAEWWRGVQTLAEEDAQVKTLLRVAIHHADILRVTAAGPPVRRLGFETNAEFLAAMDTARRRGTQYREALAVIEASESAPAEDEAPAPDEPDASGTPDRAPVTSAAGGESDNEDS